MKTTRQCELIKQYGAKQIIEALRPYITQPRQQRIEEVLAARISSIQLAIECPTDMHNALAAVRSAEALGITSVHIICPEGDARHAQSITQGAIYWVNVHFYPTLQDFLAVAKHQQWLLAAGTLKAQHSVNDIPIQHPLCIMLGNEQRGLSQAAQHACSFHYKIPMFGMTESFNLSVSAAISLYSTTARKRKQLNQLGDLTNQQAQQLQAQYYLNSVAPRLSSALLKKLK